MSESVLKGYADVFGKHACAISDHTGPASYPAGGETLVLPSPLGLRSIDFVATEEYTVSGNYRVIPQSLVGGGASNAKAKLKWFSSPNTVPGVPLSLGPATAASTVSAVTAGVGSITVANTFKAGAFCLLTLFTQAGALNGTIVRLATATSTGVTFNLGSAATLVSGADITGKLQLIQVAVGNPLQEGATAAITNSIGTASLLTMTSSLNPPVGSFVYIDNLVNGAKANGVIVQVASSSTTSFTANWNGTGNTFTTAADTGNVWQLVTNGGALVTTGNTYSITNSVATASSAGTAGVISLSAVNNLTAGLIGVIQGLTNGAVLNGIISAVISTSLTAALFKLNSQTQAVTTGADAGTFAVLFTGSPVGTGEVPAGTNLSGETVRILAIGG
jgi:hypothetical protein